MVFAAEFQKRGCLVVGKAFGTPNVRLKISFELALAARGKAANAFHTTSAWSDPREVDPAHIRWRS
jgi:hypothetical protein